VPVGVGCEIPVPLKLIDWGLPLALSTMLTAALRDPVALGENVTLIEQFAPDETLLPQVFVWAKSPEFVPVRPTLVTLRAALPVFDSVTVCAGLVVPIFCELKVRPVVERLTAGVGVGVGVPPPPPPQATHKPATINVLANNRVAGRHRFAEVPRRNARASSPANNPSNPTGRRKLGGIFRCTKGGALAEAVVVMVSVSVTAEVPLTVTEGDASVQVAPVGQPLATLRLTVPVNPNCGATLIVALPPCPGAEMLMGEGFADRLKSATATDVAPEVEPV
jgi:hypothetical protein